MRKSQPHCARQTQGLKESKLISSDRDLQEFVHTQRQNVPCLNGQDVINLAVTEALVYNVWGKHFLKIEQFCCLVFVQLS